jgi:adenylate kinase family enzyme
MIVMINGAFGSGKTTSANMLLPLVLNSMIFDPEEIGYMLRKIVIEEIRLEEERTDDFQDIELWRILTVKVANELKQKYKKHLIVPMTIYKSQNFEYIYNGFKNIDKDIYHFCLLASEKTLHKRLIDRGDKVGGWTFQQTEKCVNALSDNRFEEHIITDHLDTNDIVDRILSRITSNEQTSVGNTHKPTDIT